MASYLRKFCMPYSIICEFLHMGACPKKLCVSIHCNFQLVFKLIYLTDCLIICCIRLPSRREDRRGAALAPKSTDEWEADDEED